MFVRIVRIKKTLDLDKLTLRRQASMKLLQQLCLADIFLSLKKKKKKLVIKFIPVQPNSNKQGK